MAARTMANLQKISQVAAYAAVYSLNTYRVQHNEAGNFFQSILDSLRGKITEEEDCVMPETAKNDPQEASEAPKPEN